MTYGNLALDSEYRRTTNSSGTRTKNDFKNIGDNAHNINRNKSVSSKNSKNENRAKKKTNKIGFGSILVSVAALGLSAAFMIIQFVEVKETLATLKDVTNTYEFTKAATEQKAFELEQSIDLSKIEEEATSRLGMQRPLSHQIEYIDIPQSDVTEMTAGEVEGFLNRTASLFKSAISNIIDFFSI